ncbi:MAG: non-canonical purine NTP pyrophosphatase, partial [Clostridia bacterium]|nr:non-canonical purine NTP pyrophosphatase [Clostridia bacterium]
MQMIIATNNAHKLTEITGILAGRYDLVSLKQAGIDVDVEETGTTLLENALLKAKTISNLSGQIA